MKAILEFNRPEDDEEFILTINAVKFALVCWNMESKMRDWLKYGNDFKTPDEAIESLREHLRELLDDSNISLDMIS